MLDLMEPDPHPRELPLHCVRDDPSLPHELIPQDLVTEQGSVSYLLKIQSVDCGEATVCTNTEFHLFSLMRKKIPSLRLHFADH